MLTLLCAVFSTAWGADATITFSELYNANTALDGITITSEESAFSITFNKNEGSTAPQYYTNGTAVRAYAKNSFTVSSSNDIEKIEITFGSSDGSNTITASDGTYSNGIWTVGTNSVNSVTFTIGGTSGQRRISAVAVTFANVSGPKDPLLSFTDNSKTLTLGDDPYTNVITSTASGNPLNDLHITYEAKNFDGTGSTDVIEVDSESGAVTTKKSGSAKVIASWLADNDGNWKPGSISYTVYVNKKDAVIQPIENTSIQIGETMNFTVITNSDGVITVESNNTDVATVSGSGTSYTINAIAKGKANITVSQAASDTYKAATSIVFSVNVTAPRPANELFYESFDEFTFGNGVFNWASASNTVISSSNDDSDNDGWEYQNAYANHQCLKLGGSKSAGKATTPGLLLNGDGELQFKAAAWQGDATTLKLSINDGYFVVNNANVTNTTVTIVEREWNDYKITLAGLEEGAKISFESNTSTSSRFFLDEVKVVVPSINVTIGSTGYATLYYSDKAFVVPEGVTAITYKTDGEGHIVRSKEYKKEGGDGTIIPQDEAVVLKGTKNTTYMFVTTTETPARDNYNALRGFDTASLTTAPTNAYYFYKLSTNTAGDDESVGFYWGATGGAAFEIPAHKAYLAILQSEFDDEVAESFVFDETVGINKVQKDALSAEGIYTLSGIRVNSDNLPKGIYIVNGKKIVIK